MADKRIPALAEQTTLNYEDKAILDRVPGLSEAKSISFETVLRSEVAVSEDATGVGTFNLDYEFKDRISATIDEDCEFSFLNTPLGSTNYLRVVKGVNDLVTFAGVTGVVDSKQINETSITYRIERKGASFYVSRVDNQFTDSLVIGDLTPSAGAVTSFSYFNSVINNNICNFEATFIYTPAAPIGIVNIDIANWNVSKYNAGVLTACSNICFEPGGVATANSYIKETLLSIYFNTSVSADTTIIINGSFRIK